LATAGGFAAGTFVRSPWDDAVSNARAHVVATALVEHREFLPEPVEAQGTVSIGSVRDLAPPPGAAALQVVTGARAKVGDVVQSGVELLQVSGRPVIALSLPFDLYRDIHPGDRGADIRALQDSLRSLGLYSMASDGEYGSSTAAAVRQLYRSLGAEPPSVSAEAQEAVKVAEDALAQATATSPAMGDASSIPGDEARLRDALDDARRAADTPVLMAEVVAIPSGGATVVSVAPVGTRLEGETTVMASLRSGQASGSVRVSVADQAFFPVGAAVDVVSTTDQSISRKATVTALSEFRPADDTSDVPGYDATVTFAEPQDVPFEDKAQIIARIDSDAPPRRGLAVPLIAVREDGKGTFVLVRQADKPVRVEVNVVMTADGYALVDSELTEGAEVIVSGGT
jgi:peptidoglycan hydrolase-like protein with peptidoglycan-binding domain